MCFSPSHPSPFCYPIQRRHQQTALDTSLPLASSRNGAGSHVDLVLFRFTSLMACASKTVMCARRNPKMSMAVCSKPFARRWSQPCLVYVHSSLHPVHTHELNIAFGCIFDKKFNTQKRTRARISVQYAILCVLLDIWNNYTLRDTT